jgi:glycosyltransferase involved in cell wall biosynthesis
MVFIQVQRVKRKLKEELFIVWDFENNCLYPNLNWFGAEYSIFHPVDKPHGKCPQKNEDFIFSVSEKILAFFPDSFQKKFINHGLSPLYEKLAKVPPRSIAYTGTIRVGYVGNLLFSNIDFEAFQFVVESFPEIAFHLIGPYFDSPANNLSGSYKTEAIILDFIQFLKNQRNVTLYGLKTPVEVANLISEFDILFICYKQNQNYLQDNSHKVLEYLSTGKLIIASPLSAYQNLEKDLILFAPQGDNLVLSDLMRMATSKLSHFNSIEKQQKRKQIALSNTYRSHVDEIEKLLQQKQKNEK